MAEFYQEFMELLRSAEIELKVWRMPVEIPDPIAFDQDQVHASYDRASVEKFWRILLSVDTVFNQFRARFIYGLSARRPSELCPVNLVHQE